MAENVSDVTGIQPLPKLSKLPETLPLEGAVRIELVEGIPSLKASDSVRNRVGELLVKQRKSELSLEEKKELDRYEEIDDYLSFINRLFRNAVQAERGQDA